MKKGDNSNIKREITLPFYIGVISLFLNRSYLPFLYWSYLPFLIGVISLFYIGVISLFQIGVTSLFI
jgi:hypothetical protein